MKHLFVTFELSPFTAGGIGRVVHNTLVAMSQEDRQQTGVLLVGRDIPPGEFQRRFPGVSAFVLPECEERFGDAQLLPPMAAYEGNPWLWRSHVILSYLLAHEEFSDLEYIEFPDWGGMAFATLQERAVSNAFPKARIAIRLHTSHAVLCLEEGYQPTESDRRLADMERKCLRDCDVLISQNLAGTDRMREIYAISREEWQGKLVEYVPPVTLEHGTAKSHSVVPKPDTPIVFGTKLQRVKDPKTFLRGACTFLVESFDSYRGQVLFSAHSFDPAYEESVLGLVPAGLSQRVRWAEVPDQDARAELIASGIFVVTSPFESLCLAAYEASMLGAVVVLNGHNPVFSDQSPWIDGKNCIKYAGTAHSLADALARAVSLSAPLEVVSVPSYPAPWDGSRPLRPETSAQTTGTPLLSVVIAISGPSNHVLSCLASCLSSSHAPMEVILVDDGSDDPQRFELLSMLESLRIAGLKIIRLQYSYGLSAARNVGIRAASGEYVLVLSPDDLIHSAFPGRSIACLERNPGLDYVLANALRFNEVEEIAEFEAGEEADPGKYRVLLGEEHCSGLVKIPLPRACAVFRRSALLGTPYNEKLEALEDWALFAELAAKGAKCVVTNEVMFYCRTPGERDLAEEGSSVQIRQRSELLRVLASDYLKYPLQFMTFSDNIGKAIEREAVVQALLGEQGVDRIRDLEENLVRRGRIIGELQDRVYGLREDLPYPKQVEVAAQIVKDFGLFDEEWYLANNKDVAESGANAYEHFRKFGLAEGRAPGPSFDPLAYFGRYPDAGAAGRPALFHFIRHGLREGRLT